MSVVVWLKQVIQYCPSYQFVYPVSTPMSYSANYAVLPADSKVVVRRTGATIVLEWNGNGKECELLVLSLALQSVIGSQERVPRRCVNLIWGPIDRSAGLVEVTLYIRGLDHEDPLYIEEEDPYLYFARCFVCGDPCDEALSEDQREENCFRCGPENLCGECRIPCLGVCMFCADLNDDFSSPADQAVWLPRLKLVHPVLHAGVIKKLDEVTQSKVPWSAPFVRFRSMSTASTVTNLSSGDDSAVSDTSDDSAVSDTSDAIDVKTNRLPTIPE